MIVILYSSSLRMLTSCGVLCNKYQVILVKCDGIVKSKIDLGLYILKLQ
jgi:hypothetical protein